jgi:hypothetical protein
MHFQDSTYELLDSLKDEGYIEQPSDCQFLKNDSEPWSWLEIRSSEMQFILNVFLARPSQDNYFIESSTWLKY